MKRPFVGCVHGIGSEPVSGGETAVYSDGESSTGETESLYQVHDGVFEGYYDGNSIPDLLEPPSQVAFYMAGTQPTLQSSSTATMNTGSAAATGVSARRSAQVLSDLMDAWATLLTTAVTPEMRDQHNADIAKLKDQIT